MEKINAAPRITADVGAINYWSGIGRTHTGESKIPDFRMASIGDGLSYPSTAKGYGELVARNDYPKLYRSAYVDW